MTLPHLLIKDDPDAAEAYRREIQRSGGDGLTHCAPSFAVAVKSHAVDYRALLMAAGLNPDTCESRAGAPRCVSWFIWVALMRASLMRASNNGRDLGDILMMKNKDNTYSPYLCTAQPQARCNVQYISNETLRQLLKEGTAELYEESEGAFDSGLMGRYWRAAEEAAAAKVKQELAAASAEANRRPRPTQGPPRKRPTLSGAPRR